MAKRSRLSWIFIAGIIIVVIIVAAVVFLNPVSKPVKTSAPELTVPPTRSMVPPTPQKAPLCISAIDGEKAPPSSIQLLVIVETCSARGMRESLFL